MESIPFMEIPFLARDIHVKTRETSQNTDLDIREFLGIDKVLQSILDEPVKNASKLTETNERIKKIAKN